MIGNMYKPIRKSVFEDINCFLCLACHNLHPFWKDLVFPPSCYTREYGVTRDLLLNGYTREIHVEAMRVDIARVGGQLLNHSRMRKKLLVPP